MALCNGSKDGILLGLRDVYLPTEWEPVTGRGSREGRKTLLAPQNFQDHLLPRRQKFFMGLLGKGHLVDPDLGGALQLAFRVLVGEMLLGKRPERSGVPPYPQPWRDL